MVGGVNAVNLTDGVDGVMCDLTAESIAEKVKMLIRNEEIRKRYGAAAAERNFVSGEDVEMLLKICDQE